MAVVYVLSVGGEPLMPTTRCGHVRILLKEKKARVVERNPFTIQLAYETEGVTQHLYLGIDPGRTNIGAAVVREDGECMFTAQLTTRNKYAPTTYIRISEPNIQISIMKFPISTESHVQNITIIVMSIPMDAPTLNLFDGTLPTTFPV